MKIQLWAVGKVHEPYVKPGVDDFTRRISKYYPLEWKLIPAAKQTTNSTPEEIKKLEAANILSALQKEDYLVLLDETGKQQSSPQLAGFIEQRANNSVRQLVFLIGGAFGVHESVAQRANFVWSLSLLVFPHQLVRLILAEQVYRACTIIRNEKYHHV
ncbi:23S rRNA (pseudouridine(1915)-N(3))-methyltransferase RlmH [Segetibacter sp. 3557_3]|uniref:23S rRNA (pseudouridine(1915)-N(3))-methyltransferase RlmH n=1 Tax=Segetibacter sp. 3557_3 TaxID=2547429 RepID=UPI0010590F61|nr:23S rRNA (pseudouridine(1915)-N(3))-methyltransferase RlmH [Segetibacter sp. 3557_3]TDH29279.1 23S rRNA (pseudouridine(1915)-N(3))-methyltransferase RlmH [Segetibacter sp. 3557_3]